MGLRLSRHCLGRVRFFSFHTLPSESGADLLRPICLVESRKRFSVHPAPRANAAPRGLLQIPEISNLFGNATKPPISGSRQVSERPVTQRVFPGAIPKPAPDSDHPRIPAAARGRRLRRP